MDGLASKLKSDDYIKQMVDEMEARVDQNEITSGEAADKVLKGFLKRQLSK